MTISKQTDDIFGGSKMNDLQNISADRPAKAQPKFGRMCYE